MKSLLVNGKVVPSKDPSLDAAKMKADVLYKLNRYYRNGVNMEVPETRVTRGHNRVHQIAVYGNNLLSIEVV